MHLSIFLLCIMFKLLISALMSIHVLGAICLDLFGVGRVFVPGVRVGDMTPAAIANA